VEQAHQALAQDHTPMTTAMAAWPERSATAHLNQAVIEAVRQKAAFWWQHRHSGFNAHQQQLLNRLLDAEPEGFSGGISLRKAIGITRASRATAWRDLADLVAKQALEPIGAGRSSAYRIRWPG